MSQFDELDEQKQQQWQSRIAQKRLDLSNSVEETLADNSLQEDDWSDEPDNADQPNSAKGIPLVNGQTGSRKSTNIIQPRLSLQTKPIPAAELDVPVQSKPIAIVRPDAPGESSQSSPLQPATQATPSEPKLAGRSTKVRLKAIPRSEEIQQSVEPDTSQHEATTSTSERLACQAGETKLQQGTRRALSGVFERGQSEIAIGNTDITPSSVVVVMLTGDPGPVVVQYVSLQPQAGFTVHLSAPAEKETRFNYAILLEELS